MTSLTFRLLGGWGIYTWQMLSSCHSGGFRSFKELGEDTKGKESQKTHTHTHTIGQGVRADVVNFRYEATSSALLPQAYGGGADTINQLKHTFHLSQDVVLEYISTLQWSRCFLSTRKEDKPIFLSSMHSP